MRATGARLGTGAIVLTGLLGLGACAQPGAVSPSPSATPDVRALCAEAVVATCEEWPDGVTVTVAEGADRPAILSFARRLHEAAGAAGLKAGASLRREAPQVAALDAEVSIPPQWQLAVFPGDLADVEATLGGVLDVAAVSGALDVFVDGDWPSVVVTDLAVFDTVFQEVSATALFAGGGTYTLYALEERLRIVHHPGSITDDAVREIADIARRYPAAEVLLQAPTEGPNHPTLYVARLTAPEAEQLAAELSDPRLSAVGPSGGPVPFVLSVVGESGPTYTGGTLGGVG